MCVCKELGAIETVFWNVVGGGGHKPVTLEFLSMYFF